MSAIAIIAGATLGRRNGFMVGALAALTSNFFFGQGMWTPWQMYAWGLVGYVGGALAYAGAFDRVDGTVRMPALLAYGFASGLLYGVVINAYDIIGFVQSLTWAGAWRVLPRQCRSILRTALRPACFWPPCTSLGAVALTVSS